MTLAPWLLPTFQTLTRAVSDDHVHHALLIAGPVGIGKRTLAEAFINAALCDARQPDGLACGTCRSCLLLAAGSHPDRVRITLETRDNGSLRSEIRIEQIRDLAQRLSLSSQYGGLQFALIDPADAMNVNAANGLLKTLEEPSSNTILVLVADRPDRLPATIRSRCQHILLREPAYRDSLEWLVASGLDEGTATAALDASLGNPGLAREFAQQGNLDLRTECANDLSALAGGRARASEVAERWLADQPDRRLWHAAIWTRDRARHLASTRNANGLTNAREIPKLAAWFDEANRTRRLLDTPLRPELVLLTLLNAWPAGVKP